MEKPDFPRDDPGAGLSGRSADGDRQGLREATLRYDGERAGCCKSENRVARPPFVVSEISDSKAATGKARR